MNEHCPQALAKCFDTSNLEKLKEMTERLPFPIHVKERASDFVEMDMDEGIGFGWGLMDEKNTNVSKWFSTKGSKFPRHTHNSKEWIIVYSGELHLTDNKGEVHILKRGDSHYNLPEEEHQAFFLEDTWYVTITIPKAEGFPNVGRK